MIYYASINVYRIKSMISAVEAVKVETVLENPQPVAAISEEEPSTLELFSYGFCCAVQGLVGFAYLALITLVPIAIQQGMWFR